MLLLTADVSDELMLTLQDELLQWNRVIEEMLFLLIVIIGKIYKEKKSGIVGAHISG